MFCCRFGYLTVLGWLHRRGWLLHLPYGLHVYAPLPLRFGCRGYAVVHALPLRLVTVHTTLDYHVLTVYHYHGYYYGSGFATAHTAWLRTRLPPRTFCGLTPHACGLPACTPATAHYLPHYVFMPTRWFAFAGSPHGWLPRCGCSSRVTPRRTRATVLPLLPAVYAHAPFYDS